MPEGIRLWLRYLLLLRRARRLERWEQRLSPEEVRLGLKEIELVQRRKALEEMRWRLAEPR